MRSIHSSERLSSIENICVIGAGSWGTAIANLLSKTEHSVSLYHYNADFSEHLNNTRIHPHLDGLTINSNIKIGSDLSMISNAQYIFIAVPTQSLRGLLQTVEISTESYIVSLTKGVEKGSYFLPSQIIRYCTSDNQEICALSGPSHAEEVALGVPTAVVVASPNMTLNRKVQELMSSSSFRTYSNSDILGVEIAGAVKNVISVASGMCAGLGFGDNTTAALVTRGLSEIVRLSKELGANASTFYGLAGIGDLCVTAFSKHSRNRQFGEKIGKGISVDDALEDMGMVIEGYYTAESLHSMMIDMNVDMPISKSVYEILYENLSPRQAILDLMSRDLTHENN